MKLLCSILLFLASVACSASTIDSAELIQQLGAKEFHARKAARAALMDMGPEIIPALKASSRSEDPEVRLACLAVLKSFRRYLKPTPLTKLAGIKSERLGPHVHVTFSNRSKANIVVVWRGFDGERDAERAWEVRPGEQKIVKNSYCGHVWVIEDEKEMPLACYVLIESPPKQEVRFIGKQAKP